MKRLNIVVPFRDRDQHLKKFTPTLRAYFARDKIDRDIPYRVLIIEQDKELPFNRGAMKNIGFLLGREESDYTCFHDVDYLPIWADYRWSDVPTALVWYGAEARCIAPGRSDEIIYHGDLDLFYGGVFLTPNGRFAQVNGYANSYWGWGFEDVDLVKRFDSTGVSVGRRKGTFEPLEHDHEGYRPGGARTAISLVNEQILDSRWSAGADNGMRQDGLANIAYEVLDRRTVPEGPAVERDAAWEIVTIRLLMQPRREQFDAIAERKETTLPKQIFQNERISRNAPCSCGSGKKFKHCHGSMAG